MTNSFPHCSIQANNKLLNLGFRREVFPRPAELPIEYHVPGPPEAEAWLKDVSEAEFLRFIAWAAQRKLGGDDGELEENRKLWRIYLEKIDVPETLRQACLLGQSTRRREFFTMAIL